jgi:hypothetical protein
MPSARSSLKGLPITDISANCAYAIFGFSMLVSVKEWPLDGSSTVQAAIRSFVILSVAILVFRLGDRLNSVISKDTARILAVYAAMDCIVTQSELRNAASASIVCLAIVAWSAVAAAVYLSSRDLGHLQYGAWQSVFSGKALVRIRRARGVVFDVISKAPFIGWMFSLGDKAATNLRVTFGDRKIWTISHYAICLAVLCGFLASGNLLADMIMDRLPLLGIHPFGKQAVESPFADDISRILSIVLCGFITYAVGARWRLHYLRYLSTVVTGFFLAFQWFVAISAKSTTSGWFYPLAFCIVMGVSRVLYRAESERNAVGRLAV